MFRICTQYPRYDRSTDALIGSGYRQEHPYHFHTLGLALKLRMKYYNTEDAYEGIVPVVLDEKGRERFSDPMNVKPVDYNDEIPF